MNIYLHTSLLDLPRSFFFKQCWGPGWSQWLNIPRWGHISWLIRWFRAALWAGAATHRCTNVGIFDSAINKRVPVSLGAAPTHSVTGKMLLAAVMVMHVLNTTCSQWPCRTQSSELQDRGSVNVMFISSWASRPAETKEENGKKQHRRARGESITCI